MSNQFFSSADVRRVLHIDSATLAAILRMGLVIPERLGIAYIWTQSDIDKLAAFVEEKKKMRQEMLDAQQARIASLIERYRNGETLEMIGLTEGITRERVRQLISKGNVSRLDGGRHIRARKRLEERTKSESIYKERRCQDFYGCDLETYFRLTGADKFRKSANHRYGTWELAPSYYNHKGAAYRSSVKWSLTLPEYAEHVWPLIQKIDRGGYQLTRIDKRKGFEVGNIDIITASEHAKRVRGFCYAHARLKEKTQQRREEAKQLFDGGMSRPALSKHFKVSPATISNWLSHERRIEA